MSKLVKQLISTIMIVIVLITPIQGASLTAIAAKTKEISITTKPKLTFEKVNERSYDNIYIELFWPIVKGATYYQVYQISDGKKWKKSQCVEWEMDLDKSLTSCRVSIEAGVKYYFKVRGVTKDKKGPFSDSITVRVNPDQVEELKFKEFTKSSVEVHYNITNGAVDYQLAYATDADFKTNLKKIILKNANDDYFELKNLKSDTRYFIKVRALKKVDGKYYKGKYSPVYEVQLDKKIIYSIKDEKLFMKKTTSLWSEDSTESKKICTLKKGTKIKTVAEGNNGWSRVLYNNKIYYIKTKYLINVDPKLIVEPPKGFKLRDGYKYINQYVIVEGQAYQLIQKVKSTDYYYVDDLGLYYIYDPDCSEETIHRGDICSHCGKTTCTPTLSGYYCVVCKKDISNGVCHPSTHFAKSHQ